MEAASLTLAFLGLLLFCFIILLLRGAVTWYYRINEIVTLLKEIRDELKKLNGWK